MCVLVCMLGWGTTFEGKYSNALYSDTQCLVLKGAQYSAH